MTKEWVYFTEWGTRYRAKPNGGQIEFYSHDENQWEASGYRNIAHLKSIAMYSDHAKFLLMAFEDALRGVKPHPVEVF